MAKYKRKDEKTSGDIVQKKEYQKYFKEMREKGKQPMTFYNWNKYGRRQGNFKIKGSTKATAKLTRSDRKRVGLPD